MLRPTPHDRAFGPTSGDGVKGPFGSRWDSGLRPFALDTASTRQNLELPT